MTMEQPEYTLPNNWSTASQRHELLQDQEDPQTITNLERTGIGQGWRCLEVGAGGGSITRWLCERVGVSGDVVAIDLDTVHIRTIDYPCLEIIESDLTRTEPPDGPFDLIHVRYVLTHLASANELFVALAKRLRPGGWFVIEETDFTTRLADPHCAPEDRKVFQSFISALEGFQSGKGMNFRFGAGLYGMARNAGLQVVWNQQSTRFIAGGSADMRFYQLAWQQVGSALVERERLSAADFERFMQLLGDPAFAFRTFLRADVVAQRN